jgi:hypothetical protein
MFAMKGCIVNVDDKPVFVLSEYLTADNRVSVLQKRYEVMETEQQSFSHGQEVEADIIWHQGKEYAVVKKPSFKEMYTAEEKAVELVSYFRKYRFFMGIVDAKIMALRIADEMLKNPAIKDDGFVGKENSSIEYKSFWREVKRIIKQQPLSNDEPTKQPRDPFYGC